MISFPIDMKLAGRARKLMNADLKGKAISVALSTKKTLITTDEANLLASVGSCAAAEEACKLTDRELAVLLALAGLQRARREMGETGSPKGKHLAWLMRLSEGQLRRATVRLRARSHGEAFNVVRLGLLEHSLNGHIWMLSAGWALVSAVEGIEIAKGGEA